MSLVRRCCRGYFYARQLYAPLSEAEDERRIWWYAILRNWYHAQIETILHKIDWLTDFIVVVYPSFCPCILSPLNMTAREDISCSEWVICFAANNFAPKTVQTKKSQCKIFLFRCAVSFSACRIELEFPRARLCAGLVNAY